VNRVGVIGRFKPNKFGLQWIRNEEKDDSTKATTKASTKVHGEPQ
jgi:hypothetical protein